MSPEFITPSTDTLLSLKPRLGPLLTYMSLLRFTCLDEHTPSDAFALSDSHTRSYSLGGTECCRAAWVKNWSLWLTGQKHASVLGRKTECFFVRVCFVWFLVHASLLVEAQLGILEEVLSCNFIMQSMSCTYNNRIVILKNISFVFNDFHPQDWVGQVYDHPIGTNIIYAVNSIESILLFSLVCIMFL